MENGKAVCNKCSRCVTCKKHVKTLFDNFCEDCHPLLKNIEPVKLEENTGISDDWTVVLITKPIPSCPNGDVETPRRVLPKQEERISDDWIVVLCDSTKIPSCPNGGPEKPLHKSKRGGNRIIKENQCYLRMFKRAYRSKVRAIFPNGAPTLEELVNRIPERSWFNRGDHLTIFQSGPGLLHVELRDGRYSMNEVIHRLYFVYKDHEVRGYSEGSLENPISVDEFEAITDEIVDFVLEGCVSVGLDVVAPELRRFGFDEVVVAESAPTVADPFVGGPGNCWERLFLTYFFGDDLFPDPKRVTISQLVKFYESIDDETWDFVCSSPVISRDGEEIVWIVVTVEADGDWHIQTVLSASDREECSASVENIEKMGKSTTLYQWTEFWSALCTYVDEQKPDLILGKSGIDTARSNMVFPENIQVVENYFTDSVREAAGQKNKICPFQIPVHNEECADRLGLPYSNLQAVSHRHPIHAALRNRQIHEVFPKLIQGPCTVSWMAQNKFEELSEVVTHEMKLVNNLMEPKDIGRYALETLSDSVFKLDEIKTPYALWHDNGHFLTPSNVMGAFVSNPDLRVLILTHVFPLASLYSKYSPEPRVYEYTIKGDMLYYTPEEHYEHTYEQPADPSLLLARSISTQDRRVKLNCSIVHSDLNSHVQIITRYELPGEHGVALRSDPFEMLPKVLRGMPDHEPMSAIMMRKLIMYAKSLANAKDANMHAKIRQLVKTELIKFPILTQDLTVKVIREILKHDPLDDLHSKYYDSFLGKIKYNTTDRFKKWLRQEFKGKYTDRWYQILEESPSMTIIDKVDVILENNEGDPSVFKWHWEVPKESRASMWKELKWWIRKMVKGDPKWEWDVEVRLEEDGIVRIQESFPALTYKTIRFKTAEHVMTAQAMDFKAAHRMLRIHDEAMLTVEQRLECPAPHGAPRGSMDNLMPRERTSQATCSSIISDRCTDVTCDKHMPDPACICNICERSREILDATPITSFDGQSVGQVKDALYDNYVNIRSALEKMSPEPGGYESEEGLRLVSNGSSSVLQGIDENTKGLSVYTEKPKKNKLNVVWRVVDNVQYSVQHSSRGLIWRLGDQEVPDPRCVSFSEPSDSKISKSSKQYKSIKDDSGSVIAVRTKIENRGKTNIPNLSSPSVSSLSVSSIVNIPRELKGKGVAREEEADDEDQQENKRGVVTKNLDKITKRTEAAVAKADELRKRREFMLPPMRDNLDDAQSVKSWKAAQDLFEKALKTPAPVMPMINLKPSAVWDALYPDSQGQRWHEVPFYPIKQYPSTLTYPKNDCLLSAVKSNLKASKTILALIIARCVPANEVVTWCEQYSVRALEVLGCHFRVNFRVAVNSRISHYGVKNGQCIPLTIVAGHFIYDKRYRVLPLIRDVGLQYAKRSVMGRLLTDLNNVPSVVWVDYPVNMKRAEAYLRALYVGKGGLLGQNPANSQKIKAWEELAGMRGRDGKTVKLALIEGDPGSAKSHPIWTVMRDYVKTPAVQVICATNVAKEDISAKLRVQDKDPKTGKGQPSSRCDTYERCLAKTGGAQVIVFDEDKYPSGFIDAYCLLKNNVEFVLFMCDRFQGKWHDPEKDSPLNLLPTNGEHMTPFSRRYMVGSRRFGPEIGNFLRIPVFQSFPYGGIHFDRTIPTSWQDLKRVYPRVDEQELRAWFKGMYVAFPARARVAMADSLNNNENETYTAMQGLTVPLMVVVIDATALGVVSDDILNNIFTRSPRIIVIKNFLPNTANDYALACHPFFSRLFDQYPKDPAGVLQPTAERSYDFRTRQGGLGQEVDVVLAGDPEKCLNRDFVEPLLPYVNFERWVSPFDSIDRGGYRMLDDQPFYQDQPMMAVRFGEPIYEKIREEQVVEPFPDLVEPITSIPIAEEREVIESFDADVRERMEREIWKGGWSEQAPDEFLLRRDAAEQRVKLRNKLFPGIPRKEADKALNSYLSKTRKGKNPLYTDPKYVNYGQLQKSTDSVSFAAGLSQRVRRQSKEANVREFQVEGCFGSEMFNRLSDFMDWKNPIPFDKDLYEECEAIFFDRRAGRSEELQKASMPRADPDYVDRLTAKSQWKLKDLIPAVAKPLQTLLVRSDEYIFKFGPYGIYLLEQILRHSPENVYIHVKKSFEDLAAWTQKFGSKCERYTELDITALDSSERGGSLQLEVEIMEHFCTPAELVRDYVEDKFNFHTDTIHFGLMRFSGEIFTFLFNTMFMLARTVTKYAIPRGSPIKVAGDDILLYDHYPIRQTWVNFEYLDHCVEKYKESDTGSFCSFLERKGRTFKDPRILLKRLLGATSMGRARDVIDGYFLDFLTIYRLKDEIFDLFNDESLFQAHQVLTTKIFNLRRDLGVNRKVDFSRDIGWMEHDAEYVHQLVLDLDFAMALSKDDTFQASESQYTRGEFDPFFALFDGSSYQ